MVRPPKTNDFTGFFSDQDRVTITPEAQAKAREEQVTKDQKDTANSINSKTEEPSDEFIQVSSSIGRAANSGNMSRQEAMAIYQKIASLI